MDQQLPHPTTISHIHNTCTQQPVCFTHALRVFTAPSNQRASPHHKHILHNQRASHTLSIIKALHTKELHTHTHSNNQRVHTPTHTFPTTKHFTHTHTHTPQRVLLPQPRCFLHTHKSKMLYSYTQQPKLSIQTPPQKKTPSTSICLPQQLILEPQDVQL